MHPSPPRRRRACDREVGLAEGQHKSIKIPESTAGCNNSSHEASPGVNDSKVYRVNSMQRGLTWNELQMQGCM